MAKLTTSDLSNLTNEQSAVATINNNFAAVETAMEKTLSRDGTTPNTMGADIDMNSNRITNLPEPTDDQEPATKAYADAISAGAGVSDYNDLTNLPTLGTAAALDVGTGAGQVVQMTGSAKLPAIDGSDLTNLGAGVNTKYGSSAGDSITTGTDNVTIGINAGTAITTGKNAIAIGKDALKSATAFAFSFIDALLRDTNIAIGPRALETTTQTWGNIAIGRNALLSVTANPSTISTPDYLTANYNVAVGDRAGEAITTGFENVYIGNNTGLATTIGNVNTAVGSESMRGNLTGIENVAVGVSALQGNTTGSRNVGIGAGTGGVQTEPNANTTGSYNVFIGHDARPASPTQRTQMTVIGANATGDRDNTVYLGSIADNVIIGGGAITTTAGLSIGAGNTARAHINLGGGNAPSSPVAGDLYWNAGDLTFAAASNVLHKLNSILFYLSPTNLGFTGGGNIWIGRNVGNVTLLPMTANGQAANNTAIGNVVGQAITTGSNNTLAGTTIGNAITTGTANTIFGFNSALSLTTGGINTIFGNSCLTGAGAAAATQNTIVGYDCGNAITSGGPNVLIGQGVGNAMTNAFGNVCVGSSTANSLTGSNNVIVGYNTGGATLTSGANNTIVGGGYTVPANWSNSVALVAGSSLKLFIDTNNNVSLNGVGSFGGGAKVTFIPDATTAPTTNPSGGGIIYSTGGNLTYRSSAGIVTNLVPVWSAHNPAPTPSAGSFTTATSTGRQITRGKVVTINGSITITTVGTGTGNLILPLPTAAANIGAASILFASTGQGAGGWVQGSSMTIVPVAALANGQVYYYSATYEIA